MYQFHGWISLCDDAGYSNPRDEHNFKVNVEWLKNEIAREEVFFEIIELINFEKRHLLTLHAHVNRRRIEAEKMAELVRQVAERFKHSKGLVFELDEQARMSGGSGVYTVTVIEDGKTCYRLDPFLSPNELTRE